METNNPIWQKAPIWLLAALEEQDPNQQEVEETILDCPEHLEIPLGFV